MTQVRFSLCTPASRSVEKQAARDADQARFDAGLISGEALAVQNDFFSSIDLSSFHLKSIGDFPVVDKPL